MTARSQTRALSLLPQSLRPLAAVVLLAATGMACGSMVSSGSVARRRRHGRLWLSAAFVLVTAMAVAPTRALAAPTDPVVAKVLRCHASGDHDYPENACPGGGYAFDGWGSTAAFRFFRVFLGFEVAELGDDPAQAIANTSRIELCFASEGEPPTCPGTGAWLVYDAAQQVGALPDPQDVAAMPSTAVQTLGISLPDVDWDDPQQASRGFFVRINGSSQTPLDALLAGGSCLNFSRLAFDTADPRVAVFGPPRDTYTPFDQIVAGYNICTPPMESCEGESFVDWCVDAGPTGNRAEWTRQVFSSIATAHIDQLQMQVDPGDQVLSWVNGSIGGVQQPYRGWISSQGVA